MKLLETSQLNREAGDARREAGRANEHIEELRSTNFVLRAKVLELEAKLNPRIITTDQREKFLNIATNFPKSPARVFVLPGSDEADAFATSIRKLLNEANYGTQGEATIKLGPMHLGRSYPYPYPSNAPLEPAGVQIVFNATNIESIVWPGIWFVVHETATNKDVGVLYSEDDVRAVPAMIKRALNDIEVPTEIFATTMMSEVKTGEWGILIVPRGH